MNTYDFDQTIYEPDSSYSFFLHCLKRYPGAVLRVVPGALRLFVSYRRGQSSAKELKEQLFSFLPAVEDMEEELRLFWERHRKNIGEWYLRQKRPDDLILSASPDFLLRPICAELGVRLIATPMDPKTGKILGLNCHDVEKVRRFEAEYPGAHTECFYSDSLSDTPMARKADIAWLVKKGRLSPWPEE